MQYPLQNFTARGLTLKAHEKLSIDRLRWTGVSRKCSKELCTDQVRTRWTATLVAPRWPTLRSTRQSTDPKGAVSTSPTWWKRTEP